MIEAAINAAASWLGIVGTLTEAPKQLGPLPFRTKDQTLQLGPNQKAWIDRKLKNVGRFAREVRAADANAARARRKAE